MRVEVEVEVEVEIEIEVEIERVGRWVLPTCLSLKAGAPKREAPLDPSAAKRRLHTT